MATQLKTNCFSISAIKYDVPHDYWKYDLISRDSSSGSSFLTLLDNLDISVIAEISKTQSINISNGFFVNYNNINYLITCYHTIKDCHVITIDENIFKKIIEFPEFDLAILVPESKFDYLNYLNILNICKIKTQLPAPETDIIINSIEGFKVSLLVAPPS